jgi:hypothetical protein
MSNLTAQERQARLRKKANVGLYLGVLNTILIVSIIVVEFII